MPEERRLSKRAQVHLYVLEHFGATVGFDSDSNAVWMT